MATADCSTTVADKSPDHASPHRKAMGKTDVISWYNLDNIQPAGAINASAQDLSKWVRFQLSDGTFQGKRLISARNMAEMHTPQMAMRPDDWGRAYNPETHQMSYGLAWMIQDYRGIHLVSHGGAIDGFRANITLLPDQKVGIVVLSNLDQENMPEALRFSLIDIVLGLSEREWDSVLMEHFGNEAKQEAAATKTLLESRVPDTKPSHELAAYAGDYVEPAYGTAVITVENGGLAPAARAFPFRYLPCEGPAARRFAGAVPPGCEWKRGFHALSGRGLCAETVRAPVRRQGSRIRASRGRIGAPVPLRPAYRRERR